MPITPLKDCESGEGHKVLQGLLPDAAMLDKALNACWDSRKYPHKPLITLSTRYPGLLHDRGPCQALGSSRANHVEDR